MTTSLSERYWLLGDLYTAYYQARQNKRNTTNQLRFELALEDNMLALYRDIDNRTYQLSPGIAFVVEEPKIREIFAATFRDRIVHHLVYDYIVDYWERRFIYDSYSCRVGKGTHFGIGRIAKFMRAASDNYRREAWVMKLDISGYFMSMNQKLMWEFNRRILDDPKAHLEPKIREVLAYLLPIIIFADPTQKVVIRGGPEKWGRLPNNKSLFYMPDGQGFPIGNLTSQLFSNVYLHQLDTFVKYKLGVKYYGRYVDDFILIHEDKDFLLAARAQIETFLRERLLLTLHPCKLYLQPVKYGVSFVGAKIKPEGIFPGNRLERNFHRFLYRTALTDQDEQWENVYASFAGHLNTYYHGVKKQNAKKTSATTLPRLEIAS